MLNAALSAVIMDIKTLLCDEATPVEQNTGQSGVLLLSRVMEHTYIWYRLKSGRSATANNSETHITNNWATVRHDDAFKSFTKSKCLSGFNSSYGTISLLVFLSVNCMYLGFRLLIGQQNQSQFYSCYFQTWQRLKKHVGCRPTYNPGVVLTGLHRLSI